jgi:hypothetical protein
VFDASMAHEVRAKSHFCDDRRACDIAGLADFPFIAPEACVYEFSIVQYPYKMCCEVAGEPVCISGIRRGSCGNKNSS